MNKISFSIALLLGLLAFSSCEKNITEPPSFDYLVFGHFYGLCIGEQCVEIFKLEPNRLFEDTNDNYPGSSAPYVGNFVELPDSLFQMVSDLPDAFPDGLWDESETVIGIPDAGDWGGLYIEFSKDGQTGFWLIDMMDANIPEYLIDFQDAVNEKLGLLVF